MATPGTEGGAPPAEGGLTQEQLIDALRREFEELRNRTTTLLSRIENNENEIRTINANYVLVADRMAELERRRTTEGVVDTRVLGKPAVDICFFGCWLYSYGDPVLQDVDERSSGVAGIGGYGRRRAPAKHE